MENVNEEDNQQAKMMELRMMEERMNAMNRQKEMIQQRLLDIENTKTSIDNLSKSDGDSIFHIGGEAFISGKPVKKNKIIIMIGADVAVEKNTEDAQRILESRKKEAEVAIKQVDEEIIKITDRLKDSALNIDMVNNNK